MIPRPPRATRTDTLFPYTTLFRSPANGRTVYRGHLFVGEQLLSDSPMRDHPLTPMRDSNLLRVLQRQSRGRVGLVPFASVEAGAAAISRSEEHTSELQSLMRISYAVFCLKKKKNKATNT